MCENLTADIIGGYYRQCRQRNRKCHFTRRYLSSVVAREILEDTWLIRLAIDVDSKLYRGKAVLNGLNAMAGRGR